MAGKTGATGQESDSPFVSISMLPVYRSLEALGRRGRFIRPAGRIAERARDVIFYSEHFETDGAAVYAQACEHGLEGTLSKVRNAPYRSGRGDYWIKVKCWQRREFVVVGFVPESTAGISALRLGEMRGGKLMYAGKVGTGWGRETAADIRAKLDQTAGISALRLGEMRGGKLMYAGKVGTGWGREKRRP
jgi:ATP-dependent DNA ligase